MLRKRFNDLQVVTKNKDSHCTKQKETKTESLKFDEVLGDF